MKQCKRHKWRVGSKEAVLIRKNIIATKLNIWCERCDKVIKANIYSDHELEQMAPKSPITHQSKKEVKKDESKI